MQLQPMPRRSFLKLSLTTMALTTGWVTSGCSFSSAPTKNQTSFGTLLMLNQTQADSLFAFAAVILPQGDDFPGIKEAGVINRLDEELFFIADNIAADFKEAVDALEYLPFIYGYFSRFSKLSPAQRLALLQSTLETGSDLVRAITNNCRLVVFTMYYGHESSWQAIKYDGPFAKIPPQMSEQRQYYARQVTQDESKELV